MPKIKTKFRSIDDWSTFSPNGPLENGPSQIGHISILQGFPAHFGSKIVFSAFNCIGV